MGCLNDKGKFFHWFGNIHLSGPCNRSCYFCIGQHMMALDGLNNLDRFPLDNINGFVDLCILRNISDVYLTGTNTEPMLYKHHRLLVNFLRERIPNVKLGIRSNGIAVPKNLDIWKLYDKASVTICSINPEINMAMMGGAPADIKSIQDVSGDMDIKVNIVLGPENRSDVLDTLHYLAKSGVRRVNLREPYGQPHVGDPLNEKGLPKTADVYGMPTYCIDGMDATYWDVHYVEVDSVNLYANGRLSELYPITKGHHDSGEVRPQEAFSKGRHKAQWQYKVQPMKIRPNDML